MQCGSLVHHGTKCSEIFKSTTSILPRVIDVERRCLTVAEDALQVTKGVPLIQSLDPAQGVKVDLRTGRTMSYLGKTVWESRAWTLRERFLAARSLVFTPEQVFWECEEAFWCEDSFRDVSNISPDPRRSSLCGGELTLTWGSDFPTVDHYYRITLEDYSGRSLTYDGDGLNAFSGIIRAFERTTKQKFFWGMPTAFMESALAWGSQSRGLRRRHGNELSIQAAQGKDWFPSWSWAGWTGGPDGRLNNQDLTTEPLGLEFYRIESGRTTTKRLKQAKRPNHEVDLLAEGSDISVRADRPHKVSIEDLPQSFHIDRSLLLCFGTASVSLRIESANLLPRQSPGTPGSHPEAIRFYQEEQVINISWFHSPDTDYVLSSLLDSTVEMIAIAPNRGDYDNHHVANGAIGVMIVSREEGLAFRRGLAWIVIRDWTALKKRTWKLITLA